MTMDAFHPILYAEAKKPIIEIDPAADNPSHPRFGAWLDKVSNPNHPDHNKWKKYNTGVGFEEKPADLKNEAELGPIFDLLARPESQTPHFSTPTRHNGLRFMAYIQGVGDIYLQKNCEVPGNYNHPTITEPCFYVKASEQDTSNTFSRVNYTRPNNSLQNKVFNALAKKRNKNPSSYNEATNYDEFDQMGNRQHPKMPKTTYENGRVALAKDLVFGWSVFTGEDGWIPLDALSEEDFYIVIKAMDNNPIFPMELREYIRDLDEQFRNAY